MEPGQLADLCSRVRLYTVGRQTLNIQVDIPKIDNGPFQKWKWDKSI
jgi:hypothetical protein